MHAYMHTRRPLSINLHLWKIKIYDTEKGRLSDKIFLNCYYGQKKPVIYDTRGMVVVMLWSTWNVFVVLA